GSAARWPRHAWRPAAPPRTCPTRPQSRAASTRPARSVLLPRFVANKSPLLFLSASGAAGPRSQLLPPPSSLPRVTGKPPAGYLEFFDGELFVRINAGLSGNGHRCFGNLQRIQIRKLQQRARRA